MKLLHVFGLTIALVVSLDGIFGKSVKSQNQELLRALSGAEEREYPHQVRFAFSQGQGTCGGTIYNKDWIITAAHCIKSNNKVTAAPGDWIIAGLSYTINSTDADKFVIAEIKSHPDWDSTEIGLGNDIALLRLERSLPLEIGKIQPIRLAPADYIPPYGGRGLIMGWGNADKSIGIGSPNLLETFAPINHPFKSARLATLPETEGGSSAASTKMAPDHVGIGGGDSGVTTGQGDSGGPLICPDANNKPVLCGVSTYKSCEAFVACQRPSYFVLTAYHRKWIEKETGAKQEENMLVDHDLFPSLVSRKDVPDFLVRVVGEKISCAGVISGRRSVITNARCYDDNNKKVLIHHHATGKQYKLAAAQKHDQYNGNMSPELAKKSMRKLASNDLAVFSVSTPFDPLKNGLELPPETYKIKQAVEYTVSEKNNGVEKRTYVPMEREECQHRVNLIDPDLKLGDDHTCMRQVYGADADCERDIGGLLVCEGKYLCGLKNFHACKWSAFPEIFTHIYGDLRAYYEAWKQN